MKITLLMLQFKSDWFKKIQMLFYILLYFLICLYSRKVTTFFNKIENIIKNHCYHIKTDMHVARMLGQLCLERTLENERRKRLLGHGCYNYYQLSERVFHVQRMSPANWMMVLFVSRTCIGHSRTHLIKYYLKNLNLHEIHAMFSYTLNTFSVNC